MNLATGGSANNVDDLLAQVTAAHDLGYKQFWTPQIFDLDALTAPKPPDEFSHR